MVMLKVPVAVCGGVEESVTCTVKVGVGVGVGVVGVPEIVLPLKESPSGKFPDVLVHVNGAVPLEANSVALYAAPTVPFGRDFVPTDNGGGGLIVMLKL